MFMSQVASFTFAQTSQQTSTKVRQLKVIQGQDSQQRINDYFHQILAEALAHSPSNIQYTLEPVDFEFSQNRTLKLLNFKDILDITYSMTSHERERDFIAIKVPLLDGMFGKRMLLVTAENKSKFEQIDLPSLKKLVACQGLHWPDYSRLKQNGYSVYGVTDFEANFKMLAKGRCDYFPRGIAEIDMDFDKYNNKFGELAIVPNIMLVYHAPIYFFVGKHQQALADDVEKGLLILQKSGRLKQALIDTDAFNYVPSYEKTANIKVFSLD